MENIWGFLLQTLSVSLVAALLLLLKWIFEDKLSPRWQYGIWSLLALRILLPVNMARYIILPLPLWIERMKTQVESMLTSAYTHVYETVRITHVLPVWRGMPVSVTDGLFVVYSLGVLVMLLWYGIAYLRLRLLLRKGMAADRELTARIQSVAWRYQLEACPAVTLHGLSSAFVCGVIHPVLVVPAGTQPDDKVILHELLHLKYRDSLQSVLWCVLRSLHWCNPFLQYVFSRIVGDMESLCDQRVLERLEGEERREYGGILLNMANEKYASMPGTTSISNGGKNISRRIAAIVRFKMYPKGMALVSICIGIILLSPLFVGNKPTYGAESYRPDTASELENSLVMSRLNRCTTIAGAIDTYVKGLMFENGIYIAMASPMNRQEELAQTLRQTSVNGKGGAYYLDSGWELEQINVEQGYRIYNLLERDDGSYETMVALAVDYFEGTASEETWQEEVKQSHVTYPITLLIPLRVVPEGKCWVVEAMGERICSDRHYPAERYNADGKLSHMALDRQVGQNGILTMATRMEYYIENWTQNESPFSFFSSMSFDQMPKTDAQFSYAWELINLEYECTAEASVRDSLEVVAMYSAPAYQDVLWPSEDNAETANTWSSTGSNSGLSGVKMPISQDWDGLIEDTNSQYLAGDELDHWKVEPHEVRIYWNGELADVFIMQEESCDGTE